MIKLKFVFNIKKIAAYGFVLHLLAPCIHIHRMIFFIKKQKNPEVLVGFIMGIFSFKFIYCVYKKLYYDMQYIYGHWKFSTLFFGIRKFIKDNEPNWAIKQKGKSHIIS